MRDLLVSQKVEVASEFAVSEVFSSQKSHAGKQSRSVVLQSVDQLQDHDDAFSEGTRAPTNLGYCFRFKHVIYRNVFFSSYKYKSLFLKVSQDWHCA